MDKSQEKTLEVKLNSIVQEILRQTNPIEVMSNIVTYHAVKELTEKLGGRVSITISHTVE